jgi:hypothetical protein
VVVAARVRLADVDASVSGGAVKVALRLEGAIDVAWRGAFARAMAGRLDGIAGRWHLQDDTLIVPSVRATGGRDLAVAVSAAVDEANLEVIEIADRAEAVRTSANQQRDRLDQEAADVRDAIAAELHTLEREARRDHRRATLGARAGDQ